MSKLTEILDQFRRDQEEKSRCTVAELARELNKDVSLLLEQFSKAGVVFSGPDDQVLEDHKQKLLDWLKSQHSTRSKKKITIRKNPAFSLFANDWKAVAAGENGAEWDCLNQFAGNVIFGVEIHPDQQRLINLIVARSVIQGVLPMKRVGRPKESRTNDLAVQAAHSYWYLVDSGCSSEKAVEILSSKLHKTERQIYRYVQSQKGSVRSTKEFREQQRVILRAIASVGGGARSWIDDFPQPDLSSLTDEDYLDHLDELIATGAKAFPDTKDQLFIDSDIDE